jgi:chemotaxis protein MotB
MARWLALLLAVALAAGYFLLFAPQRAQLAALNEELASERAARQAAERDVRISAQEASSLNSRVAESEGLLAELRQTSVQLEAAVAEKEAQLAEVRETQDALVSELEEEIAQGQVQVQRLAGQLRVDLVNEILFASGEAEVKPEGRQLLKKIAVVLEKAGRSVQVQGHTDDVPISGRLAERFPSNWELSAARAVNVARFLQQEARVDPTLLSATGFSEYHPRASNETPEGRQQNRRIEILLGPHPPRP